MFFGIFASFMKWLGFKNYQAAGAIDRASEKLAEDPNVVGHAYEEAIQKMKGSIEHHMEQVGKLVALQNGKEADLKNVEGEVTRYEGLKNGALAMAKKRMASLQAAGKTPEEIKADPEFLKHQSAYADMTSTCNEKLQRIESLKADIETGKASIESHQRRLLERKRELDKLKQEKPEMVARVINAKAQAELDMALAGVSSDNVSEGLASVRNAVNAVEGKAKVAKVLAGTNNKDAEAEYLAFARESAAVDQFSDLIGLTTATVAKEDAAKAPAEKPVDAAGVLN